MLASTTVLHSAPLEVLGRSVLVCLQPSQSPEISNKFCQQNAAQVPVCDGEVLQLSAVG